MTEEVNIEERLHYYLIAGKVIYHKKDIRNKTEQLQIELNGIIKTGVQQFNQTQIARAQQTLQMRLMTEFEDPKKIKVVDVILGSVSHLGYMTKDEFAPPVPETPLAQIADLPVNGNA